MAVSKSSDRKPFWLRALGQFSPVSAERIHRFRLMNAAMKRIKAYRRMFNRNDPHERALLKRLVKKEIFKARL
jgi:hypothetical protein